MNVYIVVITVLARFDPLAIWGVIVLVYATYRLELVVPDFLIFYDSVSYCTMPVHE